MIYAWIWRKLPGPKWLKVIESFLLITLALLILFVFVFPNVNSFFSGDPTFSDN